MGESLYDSLGRFLADTRSNEPAEKLFNRWASSTGQRLSLEEAIKGINIIRCIQSNNGFNKLSEIYGGLRNGKA